MDNEFSLVSADRNYPNLEALKNLYDISFPDCERKPFEMILSGTDSGKMDMLVCEKQDESDAPQVAGLAFVIHGKDRELLDYLAVSPDLQSHGLGSWMLSSLKKHFDKSLIVEIETTRHGDQTALDRKRFYLRNGFLESEDEIVLFGVEMELLSTQDPVGFEEYFQIMDRYFDFDASAHVKRLEIVR